MEFCTSTNFKEKQSCLTGKKQHMCVLESFNGHFDCYILHLDKLLFPFRISIKCSLFTSVVKQGKAQASSVNHDKE